MNYPVPHFGQDRDIITSFNSLDKAEGLVGHKWGAVNDKPTDWASKTLYNKDPTLDSDIIDTDEHYAAAEKRIGAENKKAAGAAAEAAAAKKAAEAKEAEAKKAAEEPAAKEEAKPAAAAVVQAKVDLHTESDPICDSAGCSQYLFPKKPAEDDHPMNYFVPHFGKGPDVIQTWNSLETAEGMLDHKWTLDEEEQKPGPPPTQYNFNPELDDDVKMTQKHRENAPKWLEIANGKKKADALI